MIALQRLPLPALIAIGAAVAGLLLGVLAGFLPRETGNYTVNDEWTAFPELGANSVESIEAALLSSPQWQLAEESAPTEETREEDSGRPAVLASLRVVAIVREPEVSALLYVGNVSQTAAQQLLLAPDSNGLVKVQPDDEIAPGWRVLDISAVRVTIGGRSEQGEGAGDEQSRQTVHYKLYEW